MSWFNPTHSTEFDIVNISDVHVFLPCSCFLCFRLLQIFTVHTDTIIATIKNSTPPKYIQYPITGLY